MIIKKLALSFVALSFTACATNFKGPPPDFTKKDAEARAEIDRFHVDSMTIEMTSIRGHLYHTGSLRHIVRDVSPTADQTLDRARFWGNMGWLAIGGALLTLTQPRDSWARQNGYWFALAFSIGSSTYGNILGNRAGREFNRDFESRFQK